MAHPHSFSFPARRLYIFISVIGFVLYFCAMKTSTSRAAFIFRVPSNIDMGIAVQAPAMAPASGFNNAWNDEPPPAEAYFLLKKSA